ncbi:hypothetical protein PV08_00785 [Exophiala spinifera]|uniref:NmrA-like domain-containing protein n=1 Tax=Exophiala spinifera TaxID=91928 RepID=A0A0D2BNV7_9EURO|nr:uncharacterized protein PV08_00785 [Exophiala spinifera]KIW20210.1 hypothetical protein PV08_00785 [Exophiala spinifera]
MSELVVVTCASGKQCGQLIPILYLDPRYKLRLVVHSETSLDRLKTKYPEAEVIRAEFGSTKDCARILDGATTLYYISPTFSQQETYFGFNVVDAALAESRKAGSRFAHFVFSSVLHPEITKLLHHDRKRYIEEYLTESMLPYTILQPSHFTDNAMAHLVAQKDSDRVVFHAAHSPEVAFSFTTLKDYAEASAKVIQERERHLYATYQLVSTLPMRYTEYVRSVGEAIGREIEIERVSFDQSVGIILERVNGKNADIEQTVKDGPEHLVLYYNARGLYSNPNILEWLIGRKATTPAQLARETIEASRMQ